MSYLHLKVLSKDTSASQTLKVSLDYEVIWRANKARLAEHISAM